MEASSAITSTPANTLTREQVRKILKSDYGSISRVAKAIDRSVATVSMYLQSKLPSQLVGRACEAEARRIMEARKHQRSMRRARGQQ